MFHPLLTITTFGALRLHSLYESHAFFATYSPATGTSFAATNVATNPETSSARFWLCGFVIVARTASLYVRVVLLFVTFLMSRETSWVADSLCGFWSVATGAGVMIVVVVFRTRAWETEMSEVIRIAARILGEV